MDTIVVYQRGSFDVDPQSGIVPTGIQRNPSGGAPSVVLRIRGGTILHASHGFTNVGGGNVHLAVSATNYVELDPRARRILVNQSAHSAENVPLYVVTTGEDRVTGIADHRGTSAA